VGGSTPATAGDDEGFFYIVDRMKDMILTGGENVYSREVESDLTPTPASRRRR
jgi:acyl-CoA synthetase (AMP-forming)/AMP-acid ligase II